MRCLSDSRPVITSSQARRRRGVIRGSRLGAVNGLGEEDQKIVILARSARARVGAAEGAAVRDETGRTYAAATVALPSLPLSAVPPGGAAPPQGGRGRGGGGAGQRRGRTRCGRPGRAGRPRPEGGRISRRHRRR